MTNSAAVVHHLERLKKLTEDMIQYLEKKPSCKLSDYRFTDVTQHIASAYHELKSAEFAL